ncbi:hypothetical protein QZH41_019074, partial [Actinostola sp. cb2023]
MTPSLSYKIMGQFKQLLTKGPGSTDAESSALELKERVGGLHKYSFSLEEPINGLLVDNKVHEIRFARKTKVGENVLTVNQEIRNCSSFLPCALADATCKAANITGKLTKCEIGCCQKDLCNSGGPIPTKGPTRPS